MREATEADGKALAELILHSPQAGRTLIGQDRSQDPFARRRPYGEVTTLVTEAPDEGLVASGTCAMKTVLVDDVPTRAGYVFDVAVDERARGRGLGAQVLAQIEDWASRRDAAFLYAHIVGGNEASLRLFAKAGYVRARELTSRVYPAFREGPQPPEDAGPVEDWDAAASLLRSIRADLVLPLDGEELRERWTTLPGWRKKDVWTTGKAILGLWDYTSVMLAVPFRLPPEQRLLGAVGRVARALRIQFPRAPRRGDPLRFGLLLGGAGDPADLARLLPVVVERARQRSLDIVVFLHDPDIRVEWTKAAFSVPDSYHLVAKRLSPEGPMIGPRPVWVDPVDI